MYRVEIEQVHRWMHHQRPGIRKHLLFISAPTAGMLLYGFWPWPTFLRGGWRHSMKHLFFFFFSKGASVQTSTIQFLMFACAYALSMMLRRLLQLIAHSAATWTVQSRPNFSIHRHKRKLTPSLCLSSATLTQALSLKHTMRRHLNRQLRRSRPPL